MNMQNKDRTGIIRGLVWIIVMSAIFVAFLAITNWVPSLVQEDSMRRLGTVEEAASFIGRDNRVLVPRYFPEGISWPPSFIFAQKKPYSAIVIEYPKKETKKTGLIIIRSSVRGGDLRLQRIAMTEIKEKTDYILKGRDAVLEVGTCAREEVCSRVSWQEEDNVTILLMSSPFEIIKVAESLIH